MNMSMQFDALTGNTCIVVNVKGELLLTCIFCVLNFTS